MNSCIQRAAWATAQVATLLVLLTGCTAVSVVATTASITASAVGLAAEATIGTVRVVGKGVGMAADAMSGSPAPDHSGIQIRESVPPAP
jgi:hypothetical protein